MLGSWIRLGYMDRVSFKARLTCRSGASVITFKDAIYFLVLNADNGRYADA